MKILESTPRTPALELEDNTLMFSGVCAPENAYDFFTVVRSEVDTILSTNSKYQLAFNLDYFNTSSSKCLFDLFKMIGQSANRNNVTVVWFHEADDEEMRESGELFSELSGVEFLFRHSN